MYLTLEIISQLILYFIALFPVLAHFMLDDLRDRDYFKTRHYKRLISQEIQKLLRNPY